MTKRVIVIASGSTEQVALRHLTAQLTADGIDVEVRFPSRHRELRFATVSQLINAALYDSGEAPDKFVVLVDTDGKTPEAAIDPIKSELERSSFRELHQRIHYAYAQWHLEAWFFCRWREFKKLLWRPIIGACRYEPTRSNSKSQASSPKLAR